MQFARLASFIILAFAATVLAAPGADNLAERCCTCSLKREFATERIMNWKDALQTLASHNPSYTVSESIPTAYYPVDFHSFFTCGLSVAFAKHRVASRLIIHRGLSPHDPRITVESISISGFESLQYVMHNVDHAPSLFSSSSIQLPKYLRSPILQTVPPSVLNPATFVTDLSWTRTKMWQNVVALVHLIFGFLTAQFCFLCFLNVINNSKGPSSGSAGSSYEPKRLPAISRITRFDHGPRSDHRSISQHPSTHSSSPSTTSPTLPNAHDRANERDRLNNAAMSPPLPLLTVAVAGPLPSTPRRPAPTIAAQCSAADHRPHHRPQAIQATAHHQSYPPQPLITPPPSIPSSFWRFPAVVLFCAPRFPAITTSQSNNHRTVQPTPRLPALRLNSRPNAQGHTRTTQPGHSVLQRQPERFRIHAPTMHANILC
ncbi:hypothetical protein B0H13DRAFT_2663022 [Mycena leptocephala]|nr:hypothetical protein B0H13DRAFT_2663022 [Mycena leptocephala]